MGSAVHGAVAVALLVRDRRSPAVFLLGLSRRRLHQVLTAPAARTARPASVHVGVRAARWRQRYAARPPRRPRSAADASAGSAHRHPAGRPRRRSPAAAQCRTDGPGRPGD